MNQPYTGLRYSYACGWYAVKNGRIPQNEIDGTLASAQMALAFAVVADGESHENALALIDWRNVRPLPECDRLSNEPGYFESTQSYIS